MDINKNIDIYMKEVGKFDLLNQEQEKKLLEEMRSANKLYAARARERLIKCNLRLVAKIAKEYQNVGLDYEDLVNEGNIGLMTAVDKFDLNKGTKLSYYASFWIKQSIRRAISNKGRTIRIPVIMIESKLKTQKFIDSYEKEHGRPPTAEQISNELKYPIKKVNKILKLNLQSDSINEKLGDGETELGDVVASDLSQLPSLLCAKNSDSEVLNKCLSKLNKRERLIIVRRYGLTGDKPETLEAIGNRLNLTRERIRQLEIAALESLRDMYKKII